MDLPAIHRAQAGLIADMDYVADVLYGRAQHVKDSLSDSAAQLAGRLLAEVGAHCEESTSWKTLHIERSRSWACGAILPDAPNVQAFWNNIKSGRYSITDVEPDALGSRRFTTMPTTARPTRPTPRSAAGCASTPGIR